MRVLSATGLESEREIPFGMLLQLLRPALGALEGIPPVQADALSAALALPRAAARSRFARSVHDRRRRAEPALPLRRGRPGRRRGRRPPRRRRSLRERAGVRRAPARGRPASSCCSACAVPRGMQLVAGLPTLVVGGAGSRVRAHADHAQLRRQRRRRARAAAASGDDGQSARAARAARRRPRRRREPRDRSAAQGAAGDCRRVRQAAGASWMPRPGPCCSWQPFAAPTSGSSPTRAARSASTTAVSTRRRTRADHACAAVASSSGIRSFAPRCIRGHRRRIGARRIGRPPMPPLRRRGPPRVASVRGGLASGCRGRRPARRGR